MICYLKNKSHVNRIMSEEDIATLIVSIFLKTISSCRVKKIKENANFICLFLQDLKNLNNIFDVHVGSDMTKKEFRQLCKTAWEKQHGFLIIDTTVNIEVSLTNFTYHIKHKNIIIFSLQKIVTMISKR